MSNLYGVREGERCPRCNYRRNEYPHFRTCIPRQKWPADMQTERKKRVVINGLVYDEDKVPQQLQTNGQTLVIPKPSAPPWDGINDQAVSGEASAPGFPDLPDVVDAGSASSPEAAPIFDNQTIFLPSEPLADGTVLSEMDRKYEAAVRDIPVPTTVDEIQRPDPDPDVYERAIAFGREMQRVEGVDVYSSRRCECGYLVPADSKNPGAAMRMHRAKNKAHKES
ncbi:MAG: hypothetical protein O2888_03395 [Chloroflexi bacterium]|nr:hypothetical protein [Chloroflexota bacterium]